MNEPFQIFIAYSRKDSSYLNELKTHLTPLERNQTIKIWYDGKIEPGTRWEAAIKEHLHEADIILLLVSADAIASDYFYEKEMANALAKHHAGTARVVPFIIRSCAWQATPLAELQALPRDGKPVDEWNSRDTAFSDAVNSLWKIVQQARTEKISAKDLKRETAKEQDLRIKEQKRQLEEQRRKDAAKEQERQQQEQAAQQRKEEQQKREAKTKIKVAKAPSQPLVATGFQATSSASPSFADKHFSTKKSIIWKLGLGGAFFSLVVLLLANAALDDGGYRINESVITVYFWAALLTFLGVVIFGISRTKMLKLHPIFSFKKAFSIGFRTGGVYSLFGFVLFFLFAIYREGYNSDMPIVFLIGVAMLVFASAVVAALVALFFREKG